MVTIKDTFTASKGVTLTPVVSEALTISRERGNSKFNKQQNLHENTANVTLSSAQHISPERAVSFANIHPS